MTSSPIFDTPKDLPRGPHRLSREEVRESQRLRLLAACVDVIAERADRLVIALVGIGLTGWPTSIPYLQPITLWGLVAASTVTVVQRLVTVYRQSRAHDLAA